MHATVFTPMEKVLLGTLAIAFALLLFSPLPLYWPDGTSASFALNHYVTGAAASLLIAAWALRNSLGQDDVKEQIVRSARNLIAFFLIVLLHFNFKLWSQLVHPTLYDETYQAFDTWAGPVIDFILLINSGFEPLRRLLPHAYHDIFVLMFFITFIALALKPSARKACEEMAVCVALILAVGGLAYTIAPAWGPFVYSLGNDPVATEIQDAMASFQRTFNASNGAAYSSSEFVSALGAMPSLHSAHTLALWAYARRYITWLGYVYLPCLIFIFTEAVAAKWHYLLDLIAGVAITFLCILISRYLCRANAISKA